MVHLWHKKSPWSELKFIQTDHNGFGYKAQERYCKNKKCNKIWRRRVEA